MIWQVVILSCVRIPVSISPIQKVGEQKPSKPRDLPVSVFFIRGLWLARPNRMCIKGGYSGVMFWSFLLSRVILKTHNVNLQLHPIPAQTPLTDLPIPPAETTWFSGATFPGISCSTPSCWSRRRRPCSMQWSLQSDGRRLFGWQRLHWKQPLFRVRLSICSELRYRDPVY